MGIPLHHIICTKHGYFGHKAVDNNATMRVSHGLPKYRRLGTFILRSMCRDITDTWLWYSFWRVVCVLLVRSSTVFACLDERLGRVRVWSEQAGGQAEAAMSASFTPSPPSTWSQGRCKHRSAAF